jgi:kexin
MRLRLACVPLLTALLFTALLLTACPPVDAPGAIASFTATPADVGAGDTVTLAWTASNAGGCRITPDVGDVALTGTAKVTPTASTDYTLFCNGAQQTAHVNVTPSVHVLTFTATPPMAALDTPITLTWTTEAATNCTLMPGTIDVKANDSLVVTPGATTTYTLGCEGGHGPATKSVTVAVVPPSGLVVPSHVAMMAGDGVVTLTWAQGDGSGNVYFASETGFDATTVEQKRDGTVFRKVTSPFVVSGLINGRTYFARVSAVSGAQETALTAEVSATPTDAPAKQDPYFTTQWHLLQASHEDINVAPAWDAGVRGEGIKVAVVDEGVDFAHEDLWQNIATGLSFDYLGNAPVSYAEHGTCVAGLVAARDLNGVGVRGVAPRASIISYNVLQDLTSANEYDSMTRNQAIVAVSNNSWGDVDDGTGLVTPSDAQWLAGVEEGTRLGRGGKGTLYFWASGNGGDAPTRDLSNYDGQANRRYVFAVSGVDDKGGDTGYAEEGANVLISAPTGGNVGRQLITTDITGAAGYNTGSTPGEHPNANYSQTMNGTSGSSPVAAGVGALILQVRPELSWRDVRRVLALSARKCDATQADWATNGAGLHVNHKYGFGMVDADAAVKLARTITPVGPEVKYSTTLSKPMVGIPDNDATGISDTITIANSGVGKVEFVEIVVTLSHARTGDLDIIVQKAAGARDVLHEPHTCQVDPVAHHEVCSTITAYPFGSTRHLDEPGDGAWTITVRDRRVGNTGQLSSWQLTLFGRP